jgi:CheY-like chemotaxis protein
MQGRRGIELADQHSPDLVLLDLHLPDMHGSELLKRLRASERTQHIPVIVVSADATERQVQRLMASGAQAYLTKPLDVHEFLRAVDDVAMKPAAEA